MRKMSKDAVAMSAALECSIRDLREAAWMVLGRRIAKFDGHIDRIAESFGFEPRTMRNFMIRYAFVRKAVEAARKRAGRPVTKGPRPNRARGRRRL